MLQMPDDRLQQISCWLKVPGLVFLNTPTTYDHITFLTMLSAYRSFQDLDIHRNKTCSNGDA
jgi:hypothetical protein